MMDKAAVAVKAKGAMDTYSPGQNGRRMIGCLVVVFLLATAGFYLWRTFGFGKGEDHYLQMVTVRGGTTLMGEPQRRVHIPTFMIDVFETRQEDYRACVDAGACTATGKNFAGENMPVGAVNWYQARDYCNWRDKRLPTAEEWERAARGHGPANIYPWGDQWDPRACNWCDNAAIDPFDRPTETVYECDGSVDGYAEAAPVDAFPKGKSPYGVYNMSGNMLEWTATPSVGSAATRYQVRGGAYWGPRGMGIPTMALKTTFVSDDPATGIADHMGIRCARSVTDGK